MKGAAFGADLGPLGLIRSVLRPGRPAPVAVPKGNAVAAARASHMRGDQWAAYDALPATVRFALQEATCEWCPLVVAAKLAPILHLAPDDGPALFVEANRAAERGEIEAFARAYQLRYRSPYPATAAQSTVLRYGGAKVPRRSAAARRQMLRQNRLAEQLAI